MKKFVLIISLFIILMGSFIIICNAQQDNSKSCEDLAKEFVDLLVKGDFAIAESYFDTTVKGSFPEDKLKDSWKLLIEQSGSFEKQTAIRREQVSGCDIVYVTCEFEKKPVDIQVAFNTVKEISGLHFFPARTEYKIPPYVKTDSYKEKEVTVGSGEWKLPGTLTIPCGKGLFPAVVLVHGSGPHDRDETIYSNKPFRDLALGLASQGIATLRYDKRKKVYGEKMASIKDITVKEEVIDDALTAVELLRKTERIDSKNIFVLGHSLGGMLIPRIGLLDSDISGFIILAGATIPLEDKILEQTIYFFSLKENLTDEEKKELEETREVVAKIKALNEKSPDEKLYGVYPKFWLDLRGYKPAEVARQLKQPLLILQGERDYQVTLEDFNLWKSALGNQKNVEFKIYPKLNHLFIEGEGKSRPEEYVTGGNIPEYVIIDIANWIKDKK